MGITYNSNAIIPAPFVSLSKQYQTSRDGTIIGSSFLIQLKGKLVPHMGSPNSSGVFWTLSGYPSDEVLNANQHLTSLIRKQEAIRTLFATEGRSLEVQGWDGSAPLKCNPRVKSIEFPDALWFNICDYTITLEADVVYLNGTALGEDGNLNTYFVSDVGEEWNIEPADERNRTFRLTHALSATGKRFYDETGTLTKQAWERARDYVLGAGLGIQSARLLASGVLDASSLQAFNYTRTQQLDELGGTFRATETWLCFDPQGQYPAVEDFTITARTQADGLTRVGVEGQIQGLEVRDNNTYSLTSTRYANASGQWGYYVRPNLKSRCEAATGLTMNSNPLATQVGINQNNGIITYSYEYDDRASNEISGAITESLTIEDDHPADVYASVPVLGRALGPVLQDVDTYTARKRTIQIEVQMPSKKNGYTPTQPNTDAMVLSNRPAGSIVFLDQNRESWNPYTGRYSRVVTYTWES